MVLLQKRNRYPLARTLYFGLSASRSLRGYAQKEQPKQEYKREAFELFGQLLDAVKNDVTKSDDCESASSEEIGGSSRDMEEKEVKKEETMSAKGGLYYYCRHT